jgi:hypothetical protein
MRATAAVWSCVLATGVLAGRALAQEPDWPGMSYTLHKDYQAVDSIGDGTFPTDHAIKMRGVLINWPGTMLDTAPGADPFMGGQWQQFLQTADAGDFGGTAMWMGQNIGKIMGTHPSGSYTSVAWLAELDRLNHDPDTGRLLRPGDLVEIRARAPGLAHNGKTNINEQHTNNPAANFDVILLQAASRPPTPQAIRLADVKEASDQFIFDATGATGAEHYQGDLIRIQDVQFTGGTWEPGQQMTITDGSGRTLPLLLGLGSGFSLYGPPTGSFDVVGVFDQEDADGADGYKAGYRLWAMDYDGSEFVLYRYVKPDFDQDGDVDADDATHFEDCASGPGVPQTSEPCMNADLDGDGDVDQADFGVLQRCLSAAEELADPMCDQ